MDIEKLIADLSKEAYGSDVEELLLEAATALSTLQGENAQLRESRDHWKRLAHELSEGVNGKDAEHERLQTENEKLRAELENYRKGHCSEGGCAAEKDRDAVLAELEQERANRLHAEQYADAFLDDCKQLNAELERVKRERDAAVALVHEWEKYGRYLSPMGFTVPPNWKED